jgi:two-component system, OmpR family, sensor histidine kinase KdpD
MTPAMRGAEDLDADRPRPSGRGDRIGDRRLATAAGERRAARPATLADDLRAVAVIAAITAVAWAARALLGVPDVEMLYLLGVMLVAAFASRRASLVGAAAAVASYDFFFVPPSYTLDVADARYLLTFAMMFGVSVLISTLTLRLREQEQAAVARERRTAALSALSRELAWAADAAGAADVAVRAAADAVGGAAVLLRAGAGDDLAPLAACPPGTALAPAELAAARWALDHGGVGGRGTFARGDAPAPAALYCAPVRTTADALGVLALRGAERPPGAEQRAFADAVARQVALALDRVRLGDAARQAALRAKAEELRSGLLSAVSHDLRTPLAAITGAATALRDDAALDPAQRRDLVEAVCEEAERLERLVSNLLDMTRLESGAVEPRREWVPLIEVVGGALTRLERRLAGRRVATEIPDDLPLASIDPVLVEQLFVNVLENAVKYTPPGSDLAVRAWREGGALAVEVADRGPGLPPGAEERVFERFFRGAHAGVRGVGLGLPIARAIAQAHGGTLVATNRPGGGAAFRLTLPPPAEPPPGPAAAVEGA